MIITTLIDSKHKNECLNEIQRIRTNINELSDQRKKREAINLSIKQFIVIIYIYIYIQKW